MIVHGTGMFEGQGKNNANCHDKTTSAFQGLMNFAKMYANAKNKRRVNKRKKAKILHLMSFMWNGHLFDFNRKPSARELVRILKNWHYRNAHVVLVGHSHGCNVINFALNNLNTHYQKLLLGKNQKRINQNKKTLRKGFAQLLFFLAPPCKQVFQNSTKRVLLCDHLYGLVNDYTTNEPIGYDQLIVPYSDEDIIAKLGSIDAGTAILMAGTMIPMTYLLYQYGNKIGGTGAYFIKTVGEKAGLCTTPSDTIDNKTKRTAASLVLLWVYTVIVAKRAGSRKFEYAHKYTDIMPINESRGDTFCIKGPKAHVQILLNGEKIGHSCPELLENLGYIWQKLTVQYPGHLACSSEFIVNIHTKTEEDRGIENLEDHRILCFLPEIKKYGHQPFRGIEKDVREQDSIIINNIYYKKILAAINKDQITKELEPFGKHDRLYHEASYDPQIGEGPHKENYDVFKTLYDKEMPVRILKK